MNERFKTFKWGEQKINNEFDIEFIVKSIRKANTLASVLLNKQQLILWKYQRENLISSEIKPNPHLVVSKLALDQFNNESIKDDLNKWQIIIIAFKYNLTPSNKLADNQNKDWLKDDISIKLANGVEASINKS